jgi:aminopeptidase-like protein
MKNELEKYFDRLWPINRSLTGDGNRETLKIFLKFHQEQNALIGLSLLNGILEMLG